MSRTPRLFVISGPSGAGKGTLVSLVRDELTNLDLTVSATTREPRENEVDGVSYHFLTKEQFRSLVDEGAFLEWDEHFENCYGTLRSEVSSRLEAGHSVILEIDVNGAFNVKAAMPEAVLIFVAPPSVDVLERRLRSRGTEDEEQIANRLARVEMEMESASRYDEVIVNDDLDQAVAELAALIVRYETDERTHA